jgi:hypothetical protein
MKKLQILILVIAGCFSFAAVFGTSWFLKKKKAQELAQLAQQQPNPAAPCSRRRRRQVPKAWSLTAKKMQCRWACPSGSFKTSSMTFAKS